jgi:hypothetical protein
MAQSVIRANPLLLNALKVAEVSNSSEARTVNASNQPGIDGIIGQAIGVDEVKIDFDTITPIQGMQIQIDDLIGVQVSIGLFRNGRMALYTGVISGSTYTSDSKTGVATGKYEFVGGSPVFV